MIKGIVNGVPKDITRIAMKGHNLAYDKIQSANINSSGKITTPQQGMNVAMAKIVVGKTYTVNGYVLAFYENEPAIGSTSYDGSRVVGTNGRPTTFTAPITGYVAFRVDGNDRDTPMCNEGTQILPYEPYGMQQGWEVRDQQGAILWGADKTLTADAGSISYRGYGLPLKGVEVEGNMTQAGTPTPDAPITPEFVGVRTNNLAEWEKGGINTLTGADEWYRTAAQGGTCEQLRSLYIPCSGNTTYVLHTNHYPVQTFISYYDADKIYISRSSGTPQGENRVFTTHETARYMRAQLAHVTADQVYPAIEENQQYAITLDSTALPYEPYGYKIPITCAGQTVPIYLGQTQTTRRVKKLVLTGDESINTPSNDVFRFQLPGYLRRLGEIIGISTHYAVVACKDSISQWTDNDELTFLVSSSGNNYMYIRDTAYNSSSTAFLQFLRDEYAAGTPVTVWYVLAEQQTGIVNEPLMKIGAYADTLTVTDQDVTITPAVGNDTITVDTTLPPRKLSLTGHIKALT